MRVVKQRREGDCGIAALTALLSTKKPDISYGDVSAAVRRVIAPRKICRGTYVKDIEAASAALGFPLRRVHRRMEYLAAVDGILGIAFEGPGSGKGTWRYAAHWVVVTGGVFVDGDGGKVWKMSEYLVDQRARPLTLLVFADEPPLRRRKLA